MTKKIIIQTKYRPVVPDNEKYWQIFKGDKKIEDFLIGRNKFEFSDSDSKSDESCMSEEPPDEERSPHNVEINSLTKQLGNQTKEYKNTEKEEIEVLQSKNKNIPRGLAPLEDLFDFYDVAKKPTIEHSDSDVEECNIGTEDKPKMIKLANSRRADMKKEYKIGRASCRERVSSPV